MDIACSSINNFKKFTTCSVITEQSTSYHCPGILSLLHCYYCNEEVSVLVKDINVANIHLLVKRFSHHQSVITSAPSQDHRYGSLAFVVEVNGKTYWNTTVQCSAELLSSFQPFIKRLVFDIQHMQASIFNIMPCERRGKVVAECLRTSCEFAPFLHYFELCDSVGNDLKSINENGLLKFLKSLHSCKQLHSFKFKDVKLQISQEAVKEAFAALATNSGIKYLTLHDCRFHLKDSVRQPFDALPFSNTLKVIDFTGTPLTGYVSAVLMGLSCNTSVVELILENCSLDLTGVNGIVLGNMLKTKTPVTAVKLNEGKVRVKSGAGT